MLLTVYEKPIYSNHRRSNILLNNNLESSFVSKFLLLQQQMIDLILYLWQSMYDAIKTLLMWTSYPRGCKHDKFIED